MSDYEFEQWLDEERQALSRPDTRASGRAGSPSGAGSAPSASRRAARAAAAPEPRPRRESPVYEDDAPSLWDRWKLVLLPLTALLLVAVILLGVGFAYANKISKISTIFPNVSVNGVNVGGMTLPEAVKALGDDPHRYDAAAVTVSFPDGQELTITAQQVGLKPLDGTAYAQAAYGYGRDGSMLSNMKAYRYCQKNPVNMAVDLASTPTVDQAALTALVTPVAQQVEQSVGATQAQIGEEQITLVKNAGLLYIDIPDLCARITAAFEQEAYAPITCAFAHMPLTEGQTEEDPGVMLQSLYDQVYTAPLDAMYDPVTGGVTDSVTGVRFDLEGARQLWEAAADGQTVTIPLIKEEPSLTGEQLSSRLFADVLAEKSTSLSGSSSARINNITLAAASMNGVVLQPGEEFGYNACLGERTASKGYQEAGVYSNGKHDTALGGGICQGSSTLYYCALYANLDITLRYDHYFTVSYLPMGLDATVSWGGPDFCFRNNRSYPIRIEAFVSNGSLTVRLLGTDVDGSYVIMTSDTWEDADYYYAQTYRNVYAADGSVISSAKEASSRYHKHEAVEATPTPAPTQAPVQEAPVYAEPEYTEPEYTEPEYTEPDVSGDGDISTPPII